MKRILLSIAVSLCIVAGAGHLHDAGAQQQEDPRLAVYRQLLVRANDELSIVTAQAQALSIENAQLKAQIEKRKQEDDAAHK